MLPLEWWWDIGVESSDVYPSVVRYRLLLDSTFFT